MTHANVPAPVAPGVEWKVKAATAASYVGGVVGLALLDALSNGTLLAAIPAPWGTLIAPLLPALITFVAGYLTKHTPRASGLGAGVDQQVEEKVAEAIAKLRLYVDPATGKATALDPKND